MNHENRGHWYLFTGLMFGIILGLLFTWLVQPVEYTDTEPSSLRDDFKNQYRAMIALAYLGNSDMLRAKARLNLLGDDDPFKVLSEQAQMTLAKAEADGSIEEARALGLLAVALGSESGVITPNSLKPSRTAILSPSSIIDPENATTINPEISPTNVNVSPSKSPIGTKQISVTNAEITATASQTKIVPTLTTPIPKTNPSTTATPTLKTGNDTFILESRTEVCDTPLDAPLFQINVEDIQGNPIPGVLIVIYWETGEDRFFTGLKPEKGLGYADYSPNQETTYMLRLGETGQPIKDLNTVECTNTFGEKYWGVLSLKFVQQ